MNYLAHLQLAGQATESRIGNFLGDFVKGSLDTHKNQYSQAILNGIATHRKVDSFTDRHKIHLRSRSRISSSYRRFSGVIIDIYYDHFLSKHWQTFSDQSLEDFIQENYQILQQNQQIMPLRLQAVLPALIAQDWLGTNRTLEGLNLTFMRVSKRLKRENNLASAASEIQLYYAELEADFLAFFPELRQYADAIQGGPKPLISVID